MPLKTRDGRLSETCCGLKSATARRALPPASQELGGAMVELALAMPILLLMVTGIFSIGVALQQKIQLTDSVNVGAMLLADNAGTLDPCALASTGIANASPFLNSADMTFTFVLNGTTYTGKSCSSSSKTSGAAGNLTQGATATVTVTYPCSISIYIGTVVPNCLLSTTLSEIVQ